MIDKHQLSEKWWAEIEYSEHDESFLTILCRRHEKRDNLYRQHYESVEDQLVHTTQGVQHISIHGSKNVAEANHVLGHPMLEDIIFGDYVMVLDDDDKFTAPGAIDNIESFANLCASVAQELPKWIMISGSVSDRKDGPFPIPWGCDWLPTRGTIPSFCMVVRRDIFFEANTAWRASKAGDWMFAQKLWTLGYRPTWLDSQAPLVETIRVSRGRAE
ncbi:MAG: hypothetical protein ABGX16_25055 [Pirellulales bacterium]